jgi:hypothetical protein
MPMSRVRAAMVVVPGIVGGESGRSRWLGSALGFAFADAVAESEVEEIEFLCWGGGLVEVVAEVLCGAAPEW